MLITTGIFPPKIGGPAQYAKNLKETIERMGKVVSLKTFNIEDHLPTGIRHLFFLLKIIPTVLYSDVALTLDTYSVGFPTVLACKLFRVKSIIRTGGDFLWEQYTERTKKKILLKNFYHTEKNNFSLKEKIIFKVTKWTLLNASCTVFSTEWQRSIFVEAYGIDSNKTSIIENYYGPKEADELCISKEFIGSTRKLVWKNLDTLKKVFDRIQKSSDTTLFLDNLSFEEFIERVKKCYAVILISLGDISPNMILDAIRFNRPFICTKEIGIYGRIKDAGIFVDPLNESEIEKSVLDILAKEGYDRAKEMVRKFDFTHTWEEIANEFISIAKSI